MLMFLLGEEKRLVPDQINKTENFDAILLVKYPSQLIPNNMLKFILMDIEGTTTSIDFVHQTLFPYASQHLAGFVREHQNTPKVQVELESVKRTTLEEEGRNLDTEGSITQLLSWIQADRKHTALKALQGYLWKSGYETGQYQGHLYEDVIPNWKKWKTEGLALGIYSSGSVAAQKLLFGYSEAGDVTAYLSAYFDTKIGHKRKAGSYHNIAKQLQLASQEILFLSDVGQELDAAKSTGMKTIQLVRPGTQPVENHLTAPDFNAIELGQLV